jgi:hypothetical protein
LRAGVGRPSDSRFTGSGAPNRGILAGYAVGLGKLISMAREQPTNTDYYISGIERFTEPVRKHAIVAALVSFLPESLIHELNEEQRVMRIVDDLEHVVRE